MICKRKRARSITKIMLNQRLSTILAWACSSTVMRLVPAFILNEILCTSVRLVSSSLRMHTVQLVAKLTYREPSRRRLFAFATSLSSHASMWRSRSYPVSFEVQSDSRPLAERSIWSFIRQPAAHNDETSSYRPAFRSCRTIPLKAAVTPWARPISLVCEAASQ